MAKSMQTVTYHSDGQFMHVMIEQGVDFPITVQVEDMVWNYKTRDDNKRKLVSGDKYFRPMTMGERLFIAEEIVRNSVNKHLQDGTLPKPHGAAEESRIKSFIFRETRKVAQQMRGKLVIDTW
jgi:hypothetical protein